MLVAGKSKRMSVGGKMGIASAKGCGATSALHLVSPGSAAARLGLGFVQ